MVILLGVNVLGYCERLWSSLGFGVIMSDDWR
jgi:hypothetical protein